MSPLEDDLKSQLKSMTDKIPEMGKGLPKDFLKALNACIFSAAKEQHKQSLTCLKVVGNTMYSCDGIRASKVQMQGEMPEFMIRAKAAEGLLDFEPTGYHVSKSWIHFTNADYAVYNIRLVNGIYPDKNVMELFKVKDGHDLKLPTELKRMVDSIQVMAEGKAIQKTINVIVNNFQIVCEAQKEAGTITKSMAIEYGGGRISFLINPGFLSQILEKMNACVYTDSKILFENKNIQHVIALKAA